MPTITIQDLLCGIGANPAAPNGGVWAKLSQRMDIFNVGLGPQWIADAVLELSMDYPFNELEITGPTVQMTSMQFDYPISTWLQTNTDIANLTPSFYMFYQVPLSTQAGQNPGIGLTYKTVDALELMLQTPGTPAYWSNFGAGRIQIAPVPDNNYYSYMRYQRQHPFSYPAALTDPILLPNEWREIIEFSAALRGANNFRMTDYATSYHNTLFGDPKHPQQLGLLAQRVSKDEMNMVSNQGTRQIRPMMRRW